jgi:pimeloyl-ACP methyl ester carboxylesterase
MPYKVNPDRPAVAQELFRGRRVQGHLGRTGSPKLWRYTSPMTISRAQLVATLVLLTGHALSTRAQVSTLAPRVGSEAYAPVPGARLFYTDTGGDGVPAVFLHAATGTTSAWQYQTPAFAAAGYRAIAYDRRGWGRTMIDANGPAGTGADDLLGLLDTLKLDRVHLVATAAGGFVAFDFALSYPARLRSLVVAASLGGVRDQEFLDLQSRIRPPQLDALPPEVRELGPAYRAANPEGTRRWVEIERQSRPAQPPTSTLRLAYSAPMRNEVTLSLLERIQVPTLLISGGADMLAPPPVMKFFAQRIRNAEFLVVPDAGHSVSWEEPELFNRSVLAFIRKH